MRKYAARQFSFLLLDIAVCKAEGKSRLKEMEGCLDICKSYWLKAETILAKHQFDNLKEEVQFFKCIKPRFIAEITYYNLLYYAEALRKVLEPDQELAFWLKESHRLEQFVNEHEVIYTYIKDECTYNDEAYFVRQQKMQDCFPASNQHPDSLISSSHDCFVATIMALERYAAYARDQLKLARLKTQVPL